MICVLKASVDRVSVDTIGRYGDRHSADISTNSRLMCRLRLGRHIYRPTSNDKHVGRHSADTSPPLGRHLADTLPKLGQYLQDIGNEIISSLLNCEGLSVAVVLFWPLTPAIFMSFFQLCFFLVIAFIYDPRYFRK